MSYCTSIIDGNLTHDAKEVKIGGSIAVEISIAVNFFYKEEVQTSFYRVIFFDEATRKYLMDRAKKGSAITVVADTRQTRKENVTYTNYLGINVLQLFTKAGSLNDAKPASKPVITQEKDNTPAVGDIIDDDLPF